MKKNLRSNLHKTAEQLSHWLTARGYEVRTSQVRHTPLLAVTGPLPQAMKARAVLSRERGSGGRPGALRRLPAALAPRILKPARGMR